MKKYATIWLATAISTIMAMPGFAATQWLVDPSGYENGVNSEAWKASERAAWYNKFANENIVSISSFSTQMDKVNKIAEIIRARFSADNAYNGAFDAYSFRDGKGIDYVYTNSFLAMCKAAGIECYVASGERAGSPGVWNVAKIDGTLYWVDIGESIDGSAPVYITRTLPDYYYTASSRVGGYSTGVLPEDYLATQVTPKQDYVDYGIMLEEEDGGPKGTKFEASKTGITSTDASGNKKFTSLTQEQMDRWNAADTAEELLALMQEFGIQ